MKKTIMMISMALTLIVNVSCEKDLQVFDDPTCRLNFYYDNVETTKDFKDQYAEGSFSFIYKGDVTQDTVWVEMESMGMVSDQDRPIELEQVDTTATMAVPGKHYVAFDDPSMAKYYVMPAGKARTRIPIVILRDASLKQETVVLKYHIKPNSYFTNGYEVFQTRSLAITDRLSEPSYWKKAFDLGYYTYSLYQLVGEWGPVKHQFMIDVTGKAWDDEFIESFMTGENAYLNYIYGKLTTELEKTNAEREAQGLPDLCEEDGTPVSFY